MPILTLPPSEPEPKREVEIKPYTWEDVRRVQIFDSIPTWKCECGLIFHGYVRKCVRKECQKPRPVTYSKMRG